MALVLAEGLSLTQMLGQLRARLDRDKVTLNSNGTPIEYVPNSIIDNVATLDNIQKVVDADTSLTAANLLNTTKTQFTQNIYNNGKKLFAITVAADIRNSMAFLLDLMNHRVVDVNLPLNPNAINPVSTTLVGPYQALFLTVMQRVFAPSLAGNGLQQRVHQVSSIPLLSSQLNAASIGTPEFDVTFHPAHLDGDHTMGRQCKLKIFVSDVHARSVMGGQIWLFAFWCQQNYYVVY